MEKVFRENIKNYTKDYDFKEIITKQHLETNIKNAKEIIAKIKNKDKRLIHKWWFW